MRDYTNSLQCISVTGINVKTIKTKCADTFVMKYFKINGFWGHKKLGRNITVAAHINLTFLTFWCSFKSVT